MELPLEAISIVRTLIARPTLQTRYHLRLRIIHDLCFYGQRQTALRLERTRRTVGRWCKQALRIAEVLAQAPEVLTAGELEKLFLAGVQDAPRSGRKAIYTAEQQCRIIALAVRKPNEFGLPVEAWTCRELAIVAEREKIARGISERTIRRMLQEVDLRPDRIKYWENPTIDDKAAFESRVREICELYQSAPEMLAAGKRVVCVDEKTGIQALERIHPDKPASPGRAALLEFEYRRHGTQVIIPIFEVGSGRILHAHVGATRTEVDFAAVIEQSLQQAPDAEWVFVADQLNTHKSEALVRLVAKAIDFTGELGNKGRRGILKSLVSREGFLGDKAHRVRFLYTPKHCSWLNQIEIWFSILSRKALRRASFSSLANLRDRLLQFVDYFNETMAKPFKWTYKGKALQA